MEIPALPIYNIPYTQNFVKATIYEPGMDGNNPVTFEYLTYEDVDGHTLSKTLINTHSGHLVKKKEYHSILEN